MGLPITRNLSHHIAEQKALRKTLMIEYYDLYVEMMKSSSENMNVFKEPYNRLVDKIKEIDDNIEETFASIEEINAPFYEKLAELEAEYKETGNMQIQAKIDEHKQDFIFKDYIVESLKITPEKKALIKKRVKKMLTNIGKN